MQRKENPHHASIIPQSTHQIVPHGLVHCYIKASGPPCINLVSVSHRGQVPPLAGNVCFVYGSLFTSTAKVLCFQSLAGKKLSKLPNFV